MINNYRIDYIGQTADYYMSFPQTEQSQKIIQKNMTMLADNATRAGNNIAARARQKVESYGPSGRVDVIV
jgi:DNA topoisomerase IB